MTAGRLSAEHAAILGAVLDRLIPADEHGPGAHEARGARYIERALAAEQREHRDAYLRGLSALQASARASHGAGFEELDAEAQDGLLAATEAHRLSCLRRTRPDPRDRGNVRRPPLGREPRTHRLGAA